VFPDPASFDPERENSRRTLAFGRGIHFCVGSALGRLEATVAIEALQRRFPDLALEPDREIPYHPNISFRGPQQLWVTASR
jgi:cytochrome P450